MILTTSRLTGRPVTADGLPWLRRIHGDPRAAATLTADGQLVPVARSQAVLEAFLTGDHPGLWLFFRRSDDAFIGYAGLRFITLADVAELELLYAACPEHWRQGYTAEAAAAILPLAPQPPIAFTLPHNLGSRGVMARLGMVWERDFIHAGLPHVLYRLPSPA